MRIFNYSKIKNQKWDSGILGLIAAIYKEAGKQELYLKQKPQELEKLVEIAKIQSTEASNAIEGILTTNTRIKQLVEEKTIEKAFRDLISLGELKKEGKGTCYCSQICKKDIETVFGLFVSVYLLTQLSALIFQ